MFGDAHLHYKGLCYEGIEDAGLLCVNATERSDWERIRDVPDERLVRFYGVHPWYVENWNDSFCADLRSFLDADPKAGVGEIGLDHARPEPILQAEAFTKQLMIASEYERCVSIHNVRSEGLIQRLLKIEGKDCRSVILHSFSGPISYIGSFTKLNAYFSVSPRMMLKSRENAELILGKIPDERLLLETDAPDIPGGFTDMQTFISDIAEIKGTDPKDLAQMTLRNLREALQ